MFGVVRKQPPLCKHLAAVRQEMLAEPEIATSRNQRHVELRIVSKTLVRVVLVNPLNAVRCRDSQFFFSRRPRSLTNAVMHAADVSWHCVANR